MHPSTRDWSRFASWFAAVTLIMLCGLVTAGCPSNAEVRADQEDFQVELDAQADALYLALESAADSREIPITQRDPVDRRLNSDWLPESEGVRRRYFLSVLFHPAAGLAIRAHIARETRIETEPFDVWENLPPDEAISAEELGIVEDTYEIWESSQ